jgi:hypothetical protein
MQSAQLGYQPGNVELVMQGRNQLKMRPLWIEFTARLNKGFTARNRKTSGVLRALLSYIVFPHSPLAGLVMA